MAHGSLRVEQQFMRTMPWPFAERAFSPAGYRPSPLRGFIVPTYPPGLPLLMAAFQRVGGRGAVFYVVPLLGVLAVWMVGRLGAYVHGPSTGAIAAVLLASSPSFLFQLVQPMSDVAATAWWTTALALAVRGTSRGAIGAGLAASLAILTRPNLLPLAAVVGLFFLSGAIRADAADADDRPAALRRLLLFVAGCVPGCLVIAAINNHLYGSPFASGYGSLRDLYSWANARPNLDRYPRWLITTQTPFICLAFLAPWLLRRRQPSNANQVVRADHVWLLLAFAGVVFLAYLFYLPFDREQWSYVRFLLPGYPPMIVLSVAVALEGVRRVADRPPARLWIAIALCGTLALWQAREASRRGAFRIELVERRYVDVGRYIDAAMLPEAIFITGLHAGSIRYYSGRLTLRYDLLPRHWLDEAVAALRAKGYHPYIVLEEGEEANFRQRFGALSELARLDWPPAARRSEPIVVHIYDPADRARFLAGEGILTGDIGLVRKPLLTFK
jgi:hypothetical protein